MKTLHTGVAGLIEQVPAVDLMPEAALLGMHRVGVAPGRQRPMPGQLIYAVAVKSVRASRRHHHSLRDCAFIRASYSRPATPASLGWLTWPAPP